MHELEELQRVATHFGGAGKKLEIETGVTDEGDPWAVFCCPESGAVLAHFARIDGTYIVDWRQLSRPLRANGMREILGRFLQHCLRSSKLNVAARTSAER
jgi:hypothetical protein